MIPSDLPDAALAYAKAGYPVFPLAPQTKGAAYCRGQWASRRHH